MSKCKNYPHCECYTDWVSPGEELDAANAESIVTLKQETENYLDTTQWLRYEPLFEKLKNKLELLPQTLHGLFIGKWLSIIELHYLWKFPEKSDLIRLRKALLSEFSANHDINYYTNEKNIPNQNLVKDTIEYFETGPGSKAFKPLEFLNLLKKQDDFVIQNKKDGKKVIAVLKALPFNDLEKHILFGLILKWFGGYPVSNLDEDCDTTLKLIQSEFLAYVGETPEKEFCKADNEQRKKFMKLGIALTTAINNNIDVRDILSQMPETIQAVISYPTFDKLFEDAARNGVFGEINNQMLLVERSRYNFEFNVWLQENKGWEYGDEIEYRKHLTKEVFKQFLRYQKEQQQEYIAAHLKENESWKLETTENKEVSDGYYEWLNLSVEDKYKDAQKTYFEKFPKGAISDFHLMEIENLENRLRDPDKYPNNLKGHNAYDIKFVVEVRKMLKHYRQLEYKSGSILKEDKMVDANLWGEERTELQHFLSVPIHDVRYKNGFLHDEIGLPIECNTYHPKYGYPGFETDSNDVITASFRPVTAYQDASTGKQIYCMYDLQILCTADEINFTNKDGKSVFKADYLQTHQKKLAVSEQDFKVIFQRELKNKRLIESPEIKIVFCEELKSHVKELVIRHKNNSAYEDGGNIAVLNSAKKFINYINRQMEGEIKVQTPDNVIGNIDILKNNGISITSYALMHVYLAMHGGKAITQQNKHIIVKQYGYSSGDQLRNDFTKYQNEDKRLELSTTNKRSADTHLERYRKILPLLKVENIKAYESATKDFEELKKVYNKYY